MQRKGRWWGGGDGGTIPDPPPAVILPSAVPVSSRSSENPPKLLEVLHQPCLALGQLPTDHCGWWCVPQGGNGEEHKHGSMLTVRMFVQEVDAWIPMFPSFLLGKVRSTNWKPPGACWGSEDVGSNPMRLWRGLVLAECLQMRSCSNTSYSVPAPDQSVFCGIV